MAIVGWLGTQLFNAFEKSFTSVADKMYDKIVLDVCLLFAVESSYARTILRKQNVGTYETSRFWILQAAEKPT